MWCLSTFKVSANLDISSVPFLDVLSLFSSVVCSAVFSRSDGSEVSLLLFAQGSYQESKAKNYACKNQWLKDSKAIIRLKEWIPAIPPALMLLTVTLFYGRCLLTLGALADLWACQTCTKDWIYGNICWFLHQQAQQWKNSWVGSIMVGKGCLKNQIYKGQWWLFYVTVLLVFYSTLHLEPENLG